MDGEANDPASVTPEFYAFASSSPAWNRRFGGGLRSKPQTLCRVCTEPYRR